MYPHRILDVSADAAEQKNGTDFFLLPDLPGQEATRIRVESKFETRATGRVALELVSVDRPTLKAGWVFTSRAAWLMSWFPSGDIVVLPMQALREHLLQHPARHQTTTAWNRNYLSWSALEDINWLVSHLEDARVLSTHFELGEPAQRSMLVGASRAKRCTAEDLVALMATRPDASTPMIPDAHALVDLMRTMQPHNRMRQDPTHQKMVSLLPASWRLTAAN